ncbi:MAG: OmpA family protein [Flavobacteriales bacterium]|nr:OmpA family protein [Flavobacteriales bacterium]
MGQFSTESDSSAEHYVRTVLMGEGVELRNVIFLGKKGSLGKFEADSSLFGMSEGLILTTGNVKGAQGPNDSPKKTTLSILPQSGRARKMVRNGDKDLNAISTEPTLDNAILQIEFVPKNEELQFNFIFASEEYLEFCGSKYNDIFAFFLSGPKIQKTNLAVLPDGKTPVSVNTINHKNNPEYFRRNDFIDRKKKSAKSIEKKQNKLGIDPQLNNSIQFDGMTTTLTASYKVIPNQVYRIKIAIADASDQSFDSAVFIEGGSFSSTGDLEQEIVEEIKKVEMEAPPIKPPSSNKEVIKELQLHYDTDAIHLADSSLRQLNTFIDDWKNCGDCRIEIVGHTDNSGTQTYNLELSLKRAQSIYDYFLKSGLSKDQLKLDGKGADAPISDNNSPKGKALNRRVEIRIIEQ